MKYLLIPIVSIVLISCSKEYKCTCDDNTVATPENAKYTTIITASSKSKAKEDCAIFEELTDQDGNQLKKYSNCSI